MNFIFEWQNKYCFCHEKIKFISSSRRVMFFLLYRQKDIGKIIDFYAPKSNNYFLANKNVIFYRCFLVCIIKRALHGGLKI